MQKILLLGGTTEASRLARHLADCGANAIFSYAGRTNSPRSQPLPTRVGGFGGVDGLVDYIRTENITHIIDATHPFAAQMSRNALDAAAQTNTPLVSFERAPWQAGTGDTWQHVADYSGVLDALGDAPRRVFLAIGKQNIDLFTSAPPHHYLLRLVDQPEAAIPLPDHALEIAAGPFDLAGDRALLQHHAIDVIVTKNAGGIGARAKLDAARELGVPVIIMDRPALPGRRILETQQEVMDWLHQDGTQSI
ncbi:cobalt-precorrin-6A reductase [Thalassobius sp. I31.1]|uniref:cobalt-precorrin-6A reductase n=1 Tax=Thalassobius sp. I31.1 TaxID=2109912 RepID=UPI000D1AD80A|nr:cobalt-precorrin-6A reductase [Thalassobius sp. I31.1]